MEKYLKTGAWSCAGVAGILMLLGSIGALIPGGRFLGHFWANYIYPVPSFIGAAILLLLLILVEKKK